MSDNGDAEVGQYPALKRRWNYGAAGYGKFGKGKSALEDRPNTRGS
jgi:hypothetical protein